MERRTQFPLAFMRCRGATASFFSMKSAGRGRTEMPKELIRRAACVGVVSRGFPLSREEQGKSRVCPPWEGVSPAQQSAQVWGREWSWGCSKAPRSPHKLRPVSKQGTLHSQSRNLEPN